MPRRFLVGGVRKPQGELLFDPATSDVLQTQEIQVAPFHSPKTPPLPAGTVLNYTVFISRGIVNSIKDLPGNMCRFIRSFLVGEPGSRCWLEHEQLGVWLPTALLGRRRCQAS